MVHNFFAGPSILPREVLDKMAQAYIDYNNTGLALAESSHRSDNFTEIINGAISLARELLQLPEEYEILFLTGGASSQFYMVPMNLLNEADTAAYINTGIWSKKAIAEAQIFGATEIIASSAEQNFNFIPKQLPETTQYKYVHLTTNNTIYGTQYRNIYPRVDCPLVADMSSDILSEPIDMTQFDLIYAGAQKNLGPVGTTLVIVKKELLGKVSRKIPTMLDYRTHIKRGSVFNTPPVMSIYGCWLNLQWIEKQGIEAISKNNQAKASLLYDTVDSCSLLHTSVAKEDRSVMNATFHIEREDAQSLFEELCKEAQIVGIKGHRSVGGYRASMYNAMKLESVEVLCQVIRKVEEQLA